MTMSVKLLQLKAVITKLNVRGPAALGTFAGDRFTPEPAPTMTEYFPTDLTDSPSDGRGIPVQPPRRYQQYLVTWQPAVPGNLVTSSAW